MKMKMKMKLNSSYIIVALLLFIFFIRFLEKGFVMKFLQNGAYKLLFIIILLIFNQGSKTLTDVKFKVKDIHIMLLIIMCIIENIAHLLEIVLKRYIPLSKLTKDLLFGSMFIMTYTCLIGYVLKTFKKDLYSTFYVGLFTLYLIVFVFKMVMSLGYLQNDKLFYEFNFIKSHTLIELQEIGFKVLLSSAVSQYFIQSTNGKLKKIII